MARRFAEAGGRSRRGAVPAVIDSRTNFADKRKEESVDEDIHAGLRRHRWPSDPCTRRRCLWGQQQVDIARHVVLGTPAGNQGLNPGTGTPQKGGTLNMLGIGDVNYMDYEHQLLHDRLPGPAHVDARPLRVPGHRRQDAPRAPDLATGPPDDQQRRPDLHGDHPDRRDVGHLAAASGHRGGRGDRAQARVQPCAAVRRPARLRDAASSATRPSAPASPRSRRPCRASPEAVHRHPPDLWRDRFSGQTITYKLVHPASYFAAMLSLPRVQPGTGREPRLRTRERRGAAAHDRRRPIHGAELHAHAQHRVRAQPGVERERPTRSARRTSTRSSSPRPVRRRPTSSSCRPTPRPRRWSGTASRPSRRSRA